MERMNKPLWRNSRKAWYLQHGSSQIKLAENKAEAFAKWHEIMSTGLPVKDEKITLAKVCEQYLEEVKTTRSERTWQWYTYHFEIITHELKGVTAAEDVQMRAASAMIHGKKDWSQNSRHMTLPKISRH